MGVLAVASIGVLAACGAAGSQGTTSAPAGPTPSTATTVPATTIPASPPRGADPLDTPAPSWRYPPGVSVDQARVDALQAALGGPIVVAHDAVHSWTFTGPGQPLNTDAVWRATGADPTTLDVSVNGVSTTARARLGAALSPLATVILTTPDGRVATATGHLADPVAGPDVARTGTAAAAARLAAAPASSPSSPNTPVPSPDPHQPIAVNPSMSVPGVCTKSDVNACAPSAEHPVVPPPAAPLSPAAVSSVAPALLAFPAADGGERLLPGYAFSLADGSSRTVPAVDANDLFTGLTEAQAATEAARQGWAYRVVARDGRELLVTQDYSPSRVNVALSGGKVDKATFG